MSDDSIRVLRGRIGGLALAARRDPKQYTSAARQAFMRKFIDDVDPARELPEQERERRAAAARRLHFVRLAYRSAKARRRRSASGQQG